MAAVDIHRVDENGYSVALHILTALDEAGDDGMKASELGTLVSVSGATVGAWMRDLRARGWAEKAPVSPGSYVVRWHITDAGRAYLAS